MIDHPSLDEVQKGLKQINTAKPPGLDGILVEVLSCCGGGGGGAHIREVMNLSSKYSKSLMTIAENP